MKLQAHSQPGRLRRTALAGPAAPSAVVDALTEYDRPAVLESSAVDSRYGRRTLLACRPLAWIDLRDGVLRDNAGRALADDDDGIWRALADAFAVVDVDAPDDDYGPGWIGYLGYELGRHVERLPSRAVRDTALPELHLAFYDALLIHDTTERTWQLAELVFDDPPAGAGQAGATLRSLLADANPRRMEDPFGRLTACSPPAPQGGKFSAPSPAGRGRVTAFQAGTHDLPPSNFTPEAYRAAVQRCIDYIAAGDIFQVNLSQRFTVADAPPAIDIYRALRKRNPAWYAAYLALPTPAGRAAIASSSPELFLRVRGRHVTTRPIKGTRPRTGDTATDAAAAADLQASAKDNAELAMIIDLLRNDLGRVCRFGTVRVSEAASLEAHPSVYHLVGTVTGELREDVGPAELLRATFPGGSVTGAPKIRAMEIIDDLEGLARDVYTGCVGIVGVNGTAEWNIAIRTVVCDGGRALVQAGGGIVADSTPDGEYRETLDKARALLEAIYMAGGP
ncbi:MAG: aminodeoxychorismate synthase, component I [Planctomycetes bacterium]|jgi:para-aminobenzoate synthetase component 1|nr:aminodeoxychorismate synthase, component I [Planctomycetota bacterium]